MFKEERTEPMFEWSMLGDISKGRPNLGTTVDVQLYRLMQFTLRDVLIQEVGPERAEQVFFQAGELAGRHYHRNVLQKAEDLNAFFSNLQQSLKDLQVGIFRVESADPDKGEFVVTVAEDLDCSGIAMCSEQVCTYDEGFISGLLLEQTGKRFQVKEVDCWGTGDRVCRFDIHAGE